jgi:hypothetical protein
MLIKLCIWILCSLCILLSLNFIIHVIYIMFIVGIILISLIMVLYSAVKRLSLPCERTTCRYGTPPMKGPWMSCWILKWMCKHYLFHWFLGCDWANFDLSEQFHWPVWWRKSISWTRHRSFHRQHNETQTEPGRQGYYEHYVNHILYAYYLHYVNYIHYAHYLIFRFTLCLVLLITYGWGSVLPLPRRLMV